jgi:transposase
MQSKVKAINFSEQNVFVGIDTHLKNWRVSIMLDHIEVKTFSHNPNAEELSRYLKRHYPGGTYYSAYEAGFCGFSVHRLLEKNGIKNIVVNPADIPTTDKERKQKEDKRDSRKIARSLRSGELKAIYVPQETTVEFRSMVRYRKNLVQQIAQNKCRIKSFLNTSGYFIPKELETSSKYWSGRFTQWLRKIETTTDYGKMVLNDLLDNTEFLRTKVLNINKVLRQLSREGEYSDKLQLLCSIPGIGLITAVTFLSEVENINRFKNLDSFCSYVGLIPTTNSTGDKDRTGQITPRSNKPLRTVIIEAAWMASRTDPSLALCFNNLCKRMKKNDAIIRIAKKLLNRIRFVLKNETNYVQAII